MTASDFIYSSAILAEITRRYIPSGDFLKYYSILDDIERRSLVYHYIMDNTPFAFEEIFKKPLLFEQIKQYISHIVEVDINHVKLIGSTKTGFRMDKDDYGASYKEDSDLDFMIIDQGLFEKLEKEFSKWAKAYKDGEMKPRNDVEASYWKENIYRLLPRTINYGFLDTNKMPNRELLTLTKRINNTMYNVVSKLRSSHGLKVTKASMRVYRDVDSFYCQQCRNIDTIILKQIQPDKEI